MVFYLSLIDEGRDKAKSLYIGIPTLVAVDSGVDIAVSTSFFSYAHEISFVVLFVCRSINFHFHFFKSPGNKF